MQHNTRVSLFMVCLAAVIAAIADDAVLRQSLVSGFCDGCKRISELPKAERSVWSVFCDLDGDGHEELLAVDEVGKDRDGWCWGVAYRDSTNNDVRVCSGDYFMMCQPEAMLRVVDKNGTAVIICFKAFYSLLRGKIGTPSAKGDVRISLTTDKRFIVQPLTHREMNLLIGECQLAERLRVEHYVGADLACVQSGEMDSPRARKSAGCHIAASSREFDEFVMAYRAANKLDTAGERPVPVYIVPMDVDNDGDADLFVTSDKERVSGFDYRWVLYVKDGHGFKKADKPYWFNRSGVRRVESIEPEVVARRSSFYGVERRFYDPSVVVLGYAGGDLHSLAYRRMIAEQDRAERALISSGKSSKSDDEWLYETKDKIGFFPPLDVMEFFERPEFVRMKRLPELVFTSKSCLHGAP